MNESGSPGTRWGLIGAIILTVLNVLGDLPLVLSGIPSVNTDGAHQGAAVAFILATCLTFLLGLGTLFGVGIFAARENGDPGAGRVAGGLALGASTVVGGLINSVFFSQQLGVQYDAIGVYGHRIQQVFIGASIIGAVCRLIFAVFIGMIIGVLGGLIGSKLYRSPDDEYAYVPAPNAYLGDYVPYPGFPGPPPPGYPAVAYPAPAPGFAAPGYPPPPLPGTPYLPPSGHPFGLPAIPDDAPPYVPGGTEPMPIMRPAPGTSGYRPEIVPPPGEAPPQP